MGTHTVEDKTMYIVITGNPVDGIEVFGLFTDNLAATEWGEDTDTEGTHEWWAVEVQPFEWDKQVEQLAKRT